MWEDFKDEPKKIVEDIFYIGVNDLETEAVEGICPIPHGVAYNSYIISRTIVGMHDRMSRYEAEKGVVVIYASMYGNTQLMAEAAAQGAAEAGVGKVRLHSGSRSHLANSIHDCRKKDINRVILSKQIAHFT